MNSFVITVAGAVAPLTRRAKTTAKRIGLVQVDMDGTACKVPPALATIEKLEAMGRIGKKRKAVKC